MSEMNTSQLLLALDEQRQQLAANLSNKGVAAQPSEGLEILVPKILDIAGGGSGSGGSDENYDYDYILIKNAGTTKYFEVNLYDYVDNLDDIEFVAYQFVNSVAYIGIWSKQLEKSLYPLTGEETTFHKDNVLSDSGVLDRAWSSLIVPSHQYTYQPFIEVIGQTLKNLGTNILGYTDGKLYPVSGMQVYNGVPKWSNSLSTMSPSVNASYKYLIIVYKKQKENG